MRGSPFLQTVLVVAAFILAAVPVWRLTRPAADAAVVPPVAEAAPVPGAKPVPLEVEAVLVPAPTDFQIKYLNETVIAGDGPRSRFTARWAATVPPEGADLVVQARWSAKPAGDTDAPGLGAVRVRVSFPDGRTAEKTLWGANGTLADVFTVPGTTP